MAVEVRETAVTTPAGTTAAAPQVTDLSFPPRLVTRIEVRVPPGPAGTLGFRLGSGGVQVIPINPGGWVVTDDEVIGWDLTGQITSGAWQLISYNTGSLPHTVYVRFLLDLVTNSSTVPALIPAGQLSSGLPAAPAAVTIPAALLGSSVGAV